MSGDNETAVARVASPPSFADQVALVDATGVAARIAAHGARAAIGASTVEVVAMASRLMALATLADLTFDMLATADLVQEARDAETRRALKAEVSRRISVVGASLEALGYGQPQPPPQQEEEKIDGQV